MKVTGNDWKHEPFGEMVPFPYSCTFSEEQFQQISLGFKPQSMDDKWFIYLHDENSLCFHRSWTGLAVYQVKFRRENGSYIVDEALYHKGSQAHFDASTSVHDVNFMIFYYLLHDDSALLSCSGQRRS